MPAKGEPPAEGAGEKAEGVEAFSCVLGVNRLVMDPWLGMAAAGGLPKGAWLEGKAVGAEAAVPKAVAAGLPVGAAKPLGGEPNADISGVEDAAAGCWVANGDKAAAAGEGEAGACGAPNGEAEAAAGPGMTKG